MTLPTPLRMGSSANIEGKPTPVRALRSPVVKLFTILWEIPMSAVLEATTLLDRLDDLIQSKHLLQHPFYQAWTAGELSMDALRDYAGQYYQHVKAFPTYLSAVHMNCDDLEVRRHLVENLNDEEGKHPTHPELWLQFANGLGLSAIEADDNPEHAHSCHD